jgi:four helix bundle protein
VGKEQWRDAATSESWWLDEEPPSLELNDRAAGGRKPHEWDLLERTASFGERVIRFLKQVPSNARNDRLIDQLVGAATSVGANYCEANEAVSRKDFKFTIARCVKEAKETKFFLRMIAASEPQFAEDAAHSTAKPMSCSASSPPCATNRELKLVPLTFP